MLYRRFPGCRKRRSAHTTAHGRCQGAQRVAGHPRVQRRSAPAGYPACRGRDDASCLLRCQKDLWYPNQPYRPRALSQEEESTVGRGRPRGICPGPGPLIGQTRGRWPDAVLHGPRAVHLHPARILIIRVLPRAESATGCIFRQLRFGSWRHSYPRQVFPKHSPGDACKRRSGQRYGEKKRVSR